MSLIRRFVAAALVVCIAGTAVPLDAQAAMLSTETALGSEHARLAALLDREEVRARLEAHGVRAADVQARVAALTDDEAATLAARIDELPAGGVVGLILTVFLVLLITDILGFTKVFPFTRAACDRGKC
jgi:hypothetical protein